MLITVSGLEIKNSIMRCLDDRKVAEDLYWVIFTYLIGRNFTR